MKKVVYNNLGKHSPLVLVGPGVGLDNAVISIGATRVMVITVDPVSIIPGLGASSSAWLSVHLVASDYATSGLAPQFGSFEFNFPESVSMRARESYINGVGDTCRELGITIVAGHTGSYPGAELTVIGGGTLFGFANRGEYIAPTMSKPGNKIIMTKGAAIEATSSLANSFPEYTEWKIGRSLTEKAKSLFKSCSTVKDSLVSAKLGLGAGGITSMHDATEGGILGGLGEMAEASNNSFVVDLDRILIPDEVRAVCDTFAIDPLTSLSEGTLLITCNPSVVDELQRTLKRGGIEASLIGEVTRGRGLCGRKEGSSPRRMRAPNDGYWRAYARGTAEGLR
jgi:hydrogenase maturation factor